MPYTATRRSHNIFAKKISRFMLYRRARRLFGEINRGMSAFEARINRQKAGH